MSRILLQSLLLASTGLLSVGSITIVILLLISRRGWKNGLGYALGYTLSYTLMGIAVVMAGYKTAEKRSGEPGIAPAVFLLFFGALLLWLAIKNWRKKAAEQEGSRFLRTINKITPLKSFGFGLLVPFINFKNLALYMAALSVVFLSDLLLAEKITATVLVAFVFSLSVVIPVLIYLLFPQRSNQILNAIRAWIDRYSRPIGIGIPLFFGVIFLSKAISMFLSR